MRLFTAVPLSKDICLELSRSQKDLPSDAPLRFVQKNNMHITLRFLGLADINLQKRIVESLRDVSFREFSAIFEGLGAFPNPRRPKVIWAAITGGADELYCLSQEIGSKLQALGFDQDRRYHPHVTLARVGASPDFEILHKALTCENQRRFGCLRVKGFGLYSSCPTKNGPIYKKIHDFPCL